MRGIIASKVLICVFAFSMTVYAKDLQSVNNDDFVEFSIKSKKELIGYQSYLGLSFTSFLQEDGSVIAEVQVNEKLFTAYIPLNARVKAECVFIKDGKPAKIEMQDVVTLSLLYNMLQGHLDQNLLIDEKLNRFIGYLIDFHPVNEYFHNAPIIKGKEEGTRKELIKPFKYNSICNQMGETIQGVYIIEDKFVKKYGGETGCGIYTDEFDSLIVEKNTGTGGGYRCTAEKMVGPPDSDKCFGRCGSNCGFAFFAISQHTFTQECFNHDLCALATGLKDIPSLLGPCWNEFLDASDGYINAPSCEVIFSNESPTGSISEVRPTISVDIEPEMSSYVDLTSIALTLDGVLVQHTVDVNDKKVLHIYYTPDDNLKEGTHTVTVGAATLHRGILGTKKWSFTVKNDDNTTPWIGNWLQINFLTLDDNGVWDDDDPSGIGLSAVVSEDQWVETDYDNGCEITYSYTIDKDLNCLKKGVAVSKTCDFFGINPRLLDESGHLQFGKNNNIMIDYFDPQPGDDIVAFKWMRK